MKSSWVACDNLMPVCSASHVPTVRARVRHMAKLLNLWYAASMKGPDVDRVRSEQKRSAAEFLTLYNDGLPAGFPQATTASLAEYKKRYAEQFKDGTWSLDMHRKKIMDWLPGYVKSLES